MYTRPADLSDADLTSALLAGWSLAVDEITYAAVGFGSHHWQVTAGDVAWFATVDDLDARRRRIDESRADVGSRLVAALTVACILREAGMGFVVAPTRSDDGAVVRPIGDRYLLALYPHVAGEMHSWGRYEREAQKLAVLDRLVDVHQATDRVAAIAGQDDFAIESRDELHAALDDLQSPWGPGPFGVPGRDLLDRHAAAVRTAIARFDELVQAVAATPGRTVLTHGEPHRANTIDTTEGVVLIDWDTALLAPPERDLWMLSDGDDAIAARYTDRTGTAVVDDALRLYRLRWDLAEIALYVAELRRPHTDTADTRAGWDGLREYLDPARWAGDPA